MGCLAVCCAAGLGPGCAADEDEGVGPISDLPVSDPPSESGGEGREAGDDSAPPGPPGAGGEQDAPTAGGPEDAASPDLDADAGASDAGVSDAGVSDAG